MRWATANGHTLIIVHFNGVSNIVGPGNLWSIRNLQKTQKHLLNIMLVWDELVIMNQNWKWRMKLTEASWVQKIKASYINVSILWTMRKQKEKKTDRKAAQIKVAFNKEHKLLLQSLCETYYPTYRLSSLLWSLRRKILSQFLLYFLIQLSMNTIRQ